MLYMYFVYVYIYIYDVEIKSMGVQNPESRQVINANKTMLLFLNITPY